MHPRQLLSVVLTHTSDDAMAADYQSWTNVVVECRPPGSEVGTFAGTLPVVFEGDTLTPSDASNVPVAMNARNGRLLRAVP
jgi:hypothetical protein